MLAVQLTVQIERTATLKEGSIFLRSLGVQLQMCEIFSLEKYGHIISSSRHFTEISKNVLPRIKCVLMIMVHYMDAKFSQDEILVWNK